MKRLVIFALLTLAMPLIAGEKQPLAVPDKLLNAQTAYVVNEYVGEKPFENFREELKRWGRFTLVDSPQAADVLIVLKGEPSANTQAGVGVGSDGRGGMTTGIVFGGSRPHYELTIKDAKSGIDLWGDAMQETVMKKGAPQRLLKKLRKVMEAQEIRTKVR